MCAIERNRSWRCFWCYPLQTPCTFYVLVNHEPRAMGAGRSAPLNRALLLTLILSFCHFPLFPSSLCALVALPFRFYPKSPRPHHSDIFCSCHSSGTPVRGNRRANKSSFSPSLTLWSAGQHPSKVNGWEESQVLGCHLQVVICYGKLQAQAECLWLLGMWLPAM